MAAKKEMLIPPNNPASANSDALINAGGTLVYISISSWMTRPSEEGLVVVASEDAKSI